MIDLKRVLVPVDLSAGSISATIQARELAGKFGAEIHVLYVLSDVISMVPEPMAVVGLSDTATLRASMKQSLEEWVQKYFSDNDNVVPVFLTGANHSEIVHYAEEANIDLIVMGTHGATGLEHILLGSVAERVVRRAPCPVLTVRPAQQPTA